MYVLTIYSLVTCTDYNDLDAHVYGAFNLCYGIGTGCTYLLMLSFIKLTSFSRIVGPVIGGQVSLPASIYVCLDQVSNQN